MAKCGSLKEIVFLTVAVFLLITGSLFSYIFVSLQPVISENELAAIRKDLNGFVEKNKRYASHARYDFVKKKFSSHDKNLSAILEKKHCDVFACNGNSELQSEACAFFDKYAELPGKLEPIKTLPEGIVPFSEKHTRTFSEIYELLLILESLRMCAKMRNECDYVFRIQQIETALYSELTRNTYSWDHVRHLAVCVRELVEFVHQNKIEPNKAMMQLRALEALAISSETFWECTQLRTYEILKWTDCVTDSEEPFKMFFESNFGIFTSENVEYLLDADFIFRSEKVEYLHNHFPWLEKKIFLSGLVYLLANEIVTYQHLKNSDGDIVESGSACHKVDVTRSRMGFAGFRLNRWVWLRPGRARTRIAR